MQAHQQIASDYRAAFEAVNGYAPTVERDGDLFAVTTRCGCGHLSSRDLRNLTASLRKMRK